MSTQRNDTGGAASNSKNLRRSAIQTQDAPEPQTTSISRQCTAMSKRTGQRCRKPAMVDRTVCLLHGGKTPRGVASPHFRHGGYSKLLCNRPTSRVTTNLNDVPEERRCGAKTRSGEPCKNWGIAPSGRCRMHGGKSYGGFASPALEHGWYSRYWPFTMWRRELEIREQIDRYVDACMAEIRAKRAKQEAREQAKAEKLRRLFERDGAMELLLTLGLSEHDGDGDESGHDQ